MIQPHATGVGLRPQHYAELDAPPPVDFFEVIAENFMGRAELPRRQLAAAREHVPIAVHGVALNLLGAAPLDRDYLARLRELTKTFRVSYASDHLCWTASEAVHHHDLLPAPYDPDLIDYAARRAAFVQDTLGVPFGIENLSSYVTWTRDKMPEWEFYASVVEKSGCHYMLDINNIYVSAHNHGFDARAYLQAIDWSRVLQVHLAGHQTLTSGLKHDTHDRAVCDEVWELYRYAWSLGGPFPTLLEWDENVPTLEVMAEQLTKAREVRGDR